jgi:hypothetical protein
VRPSPSVSFGLSKTLVLWRVVLVVFVASILVFVPTRLVFWASVGGVLANLPEGELADGEAILILSELLRPVWLPIALAFLSGCVALWSWTVLWHAGLVRWFVYSGKKTVPLAEILSRGLFGWWRWARLGLTAVIVLAGVGVGLVAVYGAFQDRAVELADDSRLRIVLEGGILVGILAAVLVWMATLRGAWLLGDSRRRSAVLAWAGGLWGTLRQPVRSLLSLVVWVTPALAAALGPTVLAWHFELLRETIPGTILGTVGGLIVAFCQVGLFLSFAPITGQAETER